MVKAKIVIFDSDNGDIIESDNASMHYTYGADKIEEKVFEISLSNLRELKENEDAVIQFQLSELFKEIQRVMER